MNGRVVFQRFLRRTESTTCCRWLSLIRHDAVIKPIDDQQQIHRPWKLA
jgi:hypothetical protein